MFLAKKTAIFLNVLIWISVTMIQSGSIVFEAHNQVVKLCKKRWVVVVNATSSENLNAEKQHFPTSVPQQEVCHETFYDLQKIQEDLLLQFFNEKESHYYDIKSATLDGVFTSEIKPPRKLDYCQQICNNLIFYLNELIHTSAESKALYPIFTFNHSSHHRLDLLFRFLEKNSISH